MRLIAIAIVCTLLLIPIAGYSSNIIKNELLLGVVSFGLAYVALPVLLLRLWPAAPRQKRDSMEDALWNGNLLTTDYVVSNVAQIEETEDEGLHFLISTDAGTLFLSGQYLYALVESGAFPSRRLRLFRHRKTGEPYGVEPIGEGIAQWPVFEALSESQAEREQDLADSRVYSQSIQEIVRRLDLKQIREEFVSGS